MSFSILSLAIYIHKDHKSQNNSTPLHPSAHHPPIGLYSFVLLAADSWVVALSHCPFEPSSLTTSDKHNSSASASTSSKQTSHNKNNNKLKCVPLQTPLQSLVTSNLVEYRCAFTYQGPFMLFTPPNKHSANVGSSAPPPQTPQTDGRKSTSQGHARYHPALCGITGVRQ